MHIGRFASASMLLLALGLMVVPAAGQATKTKAGRSEAKAARSEAKREMHKVTRYVRFQTGETIAYGIVEGDSVRQIDGDLFGKWQPTDRTHPLSSVKLLVPSAAADAGFGAGRQLQEPPGRRRHVTTVTTTTKVTTNVQDGPNDVKIRP